MFIQSYIDLPIKDKEEAIEVTRKILEDDDMQIINILGFYPINSKFCRVEYLCSEYDYGEDEDDHAFKFDIYGEVAIAEKMVKFTILPGNLSFDDYIQGEESTMEIFFNFESNDFFFEIKPLYIGRIVYLLKVVQEKIVSKLTDQKVIETDPETKKSILQSRGIPFSISQSKKESRILKTEEAELEEEISVLENHCFLEFTNVKYKKDAYKEALKIIESIIEEKEKPKSYRMKGEFYV